MEPDESLNNSAVKLRGRRMGGRKGGGGGGEGGGEEEEKKEKEKEWKEMKNREFIPFSQFLFDENQNILIQDEPQLHLRIHGESSPVPIVRRTQPFQLIVDFIFVLILPFVGQFHEFLSTDVVTR